MPFHCASSPELRFFGLELALRPWMACRFSTLSHFGLAPSPRRAGWVRPVAVLREGAARAADSDGVVGYAVALDEALLHHERRLAAHLQVVVDAGSVGGGVDSRVAQR